MISIRLGNSEGTIDQGQLTAALKESSRLITFQDGVTRHITLRDAYWSAADRLQKGEGWPATVLPAMAWDTCLLACQPDQPAFEDELRKAYEMVLTLAVTLNMQKTANNF